jgi:hypothetical protein
VLVVRAAEGCVQLNGERGLNGEVIGDREIEDERDSLPEAREGTKDEKSRGEEESESSAVKKKDRGATDRIDGKNDEKCGQKSGQRAKKDEQRTGWGHGLEFKWEGVKFKDESLEWEVLFGRDSEILLLGQVGAKEGQGALAG